MTGSAGTVGWPEFSPIAHELEQAAIARELEKAQDLLTKLQSTVEKQLAVIHE